MTSITEEKRKKEVYKVYIHKNKINDKVYIGITGQKNVKDRWKKGNGYKGQVQFYNAIQKYGWDNFTHKVLYDNLTKEEACEKEKELIKEYDSINPLYGYNLEKGGIELPADKIKKLQHGKWKKNRTILLTSSFDRHLWKTFKNVSEAARETGLSEQYILNVCERRIINKYYDFTYCKDVV